MKPGSSQSPVGEIISAKGLHLHELIKVLI